MTILKRCTAAVSALVMLLSGAGAYNCYGEENSVDIIDKKEIIIDRTTAQLKENMRYRGAGMVSGNNSSRLLLDYKTEHPKAYEQILEYMFGKEGIGITHLKVEMGADINSSSGTEPSVMRTEDEKADVTRGAASLLNALLDLIFVVVFKFGITGSAWATVLTQALSAISCIVYCFAASGEIKLTADDLHADKDMMSRCVKTGVPIAIQNGLISISMVALQRVTNGFGETVMAAYTVSMRIEQFVQQPFSSLNAAVSTFTRQNIGAGKEKRAQNGLRYAIKISVIFSIVVLILFTLFGGAITSWFVSGKNVISISAKALIITSFFYWSLGIIHTTRGFLNGAGDTNYALVNGMAEVICRIGLSLVLTRIAFIGFWGIWLTTAATWFVTAMVSLIRYKGGKWRLHSIVK